MKDFDKEELQAVYQQGVESGSKAEDASARMTGEPVSFRKGYFDGLTGFIAQHQVDTASLGIWSNPEVLTLDDALRGYLRGLRRQKPDVAREYLTGTSTKESIYLNKDPKSEWLQPMRTQSMFARQGYRLGFVVGVVRDFDMTLGILEVPTDDPAYNAFMAGLQAEPRALPVEPRYYGDKEDLKFYEKEDFFTTQLRTHQMIDDTVYQAGLRIWLHTQGATDVPIWAIRHPEALRAFKAGLRGEVLPEYNIQPRDNLKYPSYRKESINKEKLFDDWFNPFKETTRQGERAYRLGLTARITMEAKPR